MFIVFFSFFYTDIVFNADEVSENLKKFMRESDTVARLAGDEFVIVINGLHEQEFATKVREIKELFTKPIIEIDDHKVISTISIGIAIYPKDGDNSEILLRNADLALYYAKEHGRNAFQFYTYEFTEQFLQRTELTTALREALQKKEFEVYYQPLVNLQNDTIIGLEALLRWHHPSGQIILPAVFIPIAEETGLIHSIGEWVLRSACMQTKLWQKSHPNLNIAVNISPYQFHQKNFISIVKQASEDSQLEPKNLELEITENLLLRHSAEVADKMIELKNLGVQLALDDFGTGYTSLTYLKTFPFNKVKIDKAFIKGIMDNAEDRSIVESIISISKGMGLEVLAEGVENYKQVDYLRHHSTHLIQGFYFSTALTHKECTELLNKRVPVSAE